MSLDEVCLLSLSINNIEPMVEAYLLENLNRLNAESLRKVLIKGSVPVQNLK